MHEHKNILCVRFCRWANSKWICACGNQCYIYYKLLESHGHTAEKEKKRTYVRLGVALTSVACEFCVNAQHSMEYVSRTRSSSCSTTPRLPRSSLASSLSTSLLSKTHIYTPTSTNIAGQQPKRSVCGGCGTVGLAMRHIVDVDFLCVCIRALRACR